MGFGGADSGRTRGGLGAGHVAGASVEGANERLALGPLRARGGRGLGVGGAKFLLLTWGWFNVFFFLVFVWGGGILLFLFDVRWTPRFVWF